MLMRQTGPRSSLLLPSSFSANRMSFSLLRDFVDAVRVCVCVEKEL